MIKASHILKRNNTIVIKVLLYHLLQVLVKKRSIHKPFVSFSFDVLKKEDRNKFQSNRIVILPIYLQRKVSNPSIRFLPVRLFLYINRSLLPWKSSWRSCVFSKHKEELSFSWTCSYFLLSFSVSIIQISSIKLGLKQSLRAVQQQSYSEKFYKIEKKLIFGVYFSAKVTGPQLFLEQMQVAASV